MKTALRVRFFLRLPRPLRNSAAILAIGLALVLGPGLADALSLLKGVVYEGETMTDIKPDWPAGATELINNPLRADGFRVVYAPSIFSDYDVPNDVRRFDLRIKTTDDAQSIINQFAHIKASRLCISLDPGSDSVSGWRKGIVAVFSLGCQSEIDAWFSTLPTDESGHRKMGERVLTTPPTAMPPTLYLYAGSQEIDLLKLRIPPKIDVLKSPGNTPTSPVLENIDRFIDQHNRRRREVGLPNADTRDPSIWFPSEAPKHD